jgi:FkbM family methyltransferase
MDISSLQYDVRAPWGQFPLEGRAGRHIGCLRQLPACFPFKRIALWWRHFWKKKAPHPVDLETLGFRLRLHPLDNFCENRLLFMPQFYDVGEQKFLAETLQPEWSFVDIGANIGIYTLFASRNIGPKGKLLAVEAEPENFRRLSFNCSLNGLESAKLVNRAVSDHAGRLEFSINTRNRGENSIHAQMVSGAHRETIVVQAEPLANLLRKAQFDHVDLMKIDIEGHEERALKPFFAEAENALLWPQFLMVESPRHQPRRDLLNLLQAQNYEQIRQTETNAILRRKP